MQISENKVKFEYNGVILFLSFCGEGVWRLQSVKDGKSDDYGASQVLSRDLGEKPFDVTREITADETKGFLTVRGDDGSFVTADKKYITFYDPSGNARKIITRISRKRNEISAAFLLGNKDAVYGTGERFDSVNQRGKSTVIYAIDKWCSKHGNSYVPVPFVIISDCTAVFQNRFELSRINARSRLEFIQSDAVLDLYVMYASSPDKLLTAYSRISGFAPLPPKWAFGTLVCRYHPEFAAKEGVYAMSEEMEKNGFPWDGIIMEGFRSWKTEKWDEQREISEKLHADNKKVMIYEQCGRFPDSYHSEKLGLEDKLAVNFPDNVQLHETRSLNLIDNLHRKSMKCYDLTNPETVEKWNGIWDKFRDEMLIDGAKIDFCEQFPDDKPLRFFDGRETPGAHHWYPVLYNSLRYRQFNQSDRGGLCFSRGGGIGAQRYPFIWAGDQMREYRFFKNVIKAALSLGLSGVPFVSWDMAGYMPAINPLDRLEESKIFIRGVEFTCFSPVIQTHGKVKRPYDFDEHTKDVYRAYSTLHEKLRPYLLEQAEISCKTGLPLMRHLFLYDCKDEKLRGIEDEYMLGSALLIAPVTGRGKKRKIYLPEGKWQDIFTKKEYEGGKTIKNYPVPLESIPVFRLLDAPSDTVEKVLSDSSALINEINSFTKG